MLSFESSGVQSSVLRPKSPKADGFFVRFFPRASRTLSLFCGREDCFNDFYLFLVILPCTFSLIYFSSSALPFSPWFSFHHSSPRFSPTGTSSSDDCLFCSPDAPSPLDFGLFFFFYCVILRQTRDSLIPLPLFLMVDTHDGFRCFFPRIVDFFSYLYPP